MPDLNEKAINAIKNFQNKIDSMGLPFVLLRKLNGIRNAIEMHVEDYKDRLCERSEPQSYPVVGQARCICIFCEMGSSLLLTLA